MRSPVWRVIDPHSFPRVGRAILLHRSSVALDIESHVIARSRGAISYHRKNHLSPTYNGEKQLRHFAASSLICCRSVFSQSTYTSIWPCRVVQAAALCTPLRVLFSLWVPRLEDQLLSEDCSCMFSVADNPGLLLPYLRLKYIVSQVHHPYYSRIRKTWLRDTLKTIFVIPEVDSASAWPLTLIPLDAHELLMTGAGASWIFALSLCSRQWICLEFST